jgi:hypothetical protein
VIVDQQDSKQIIFVPPLEQESPKNGGGAAPGNHESGRQNRVKSTSRRPSKITPKISQITCKKVNFTPFLEQMAHFCV